MNPTGNYDVGRKEAVVIDPGMMADMVSAPKRDVVANSDEGLNGVVFEDEAVLSGAPPIQHVRTGADKTGEWIPQAF